MSALSLRQLIFMLALRTGLAYGYDRPSGGSRIHEATNVLLSYSYQSVCKIKRDCEGKDLKVAGSSSSYIRSLVQL